MNKAIGITIMAMSVLLNACSSEMGQSDGKELIGRSDIKIPDGRLSPEALWAMGRIGDVNVSPDGQKIVYSVAYYSVPADKSNRELFVMNADGSDNKQITHSAFSENQAVWIKNGTKIAYLSTESGSSQVWEMNPDGTGKKQLSHFDGNIEGFRFSPDEKHLLFVAQVKTIPSTADKYPDLPKVIYVDMVQCQGLMHDTYVYGLNVKGILSTLIGPLEVLDGAIVSGNCAAPGHKNATIHHENNPIILDLLKHHGKDLCFVGVLLSNESAMLKEKMRAAYYTANLSQIIGVDGIIASEEGGGNPETDLMLNCKFHEQKGIKTVLVTDEYCGRDGASQGLADVTPEADAVVTNGNGNQFVVLPKMDKIIGDIEAARVITGGNANSIGEDGTLSVEIAAIMGSCCEMGYEHMTTRLR